MSPQDRFRRLIVDYVGPGPRGAAERIENEFLVDVEGPVHLRLDSAREEITFAAPLHLGDGEGRGVDPAVIAEFNAFHLFHGGYRLFVEEGFDMIIFSQTRALSTVERTGIEAALEIFVPHWENCMRWFGFGGNSELEGSDGSKS